MEEHAHQVRQLETVGRLAGGIAHDFNSLLSAIMSYADVLRADIPNGVARVANVDEIADAAERAARLTHQLLAFGRQQILRPRLLDLNAVVASMEPMLRGAVGEGIDLRLLLRPDVGCITANEGQLQYVITHLVANAREAVGSTGQITLESMNADFDAEYQSKRPQVPAGRYTMFAVSDTGPGMDAATQARIFEPFFTTKDKATGPGLGLVTIYGIVKQSGGFVWLYSEPGRGSVFKIYLPRVDKPGTERAPTDKSSEEPAAAMQMSAPNRGTILLVEEEIGLRAAVAEALRRDGYTVLAVEGRSDALAACAAHAGPIDLVVTDANLSGMPGLEIARSVQARGGSSRVVLITAYADESPAQAGADDTEITLLQKPFSVQVLVRRVRELLAGAAAVGAPT